MLTFLLLLSAFTGCKAKNDAPSSESSTLIDAFVDEAETGPIKETKQAEPVTGDSATPFAIYRERDGVSIKLGDKREDAEKILGQQRFGLEFEGEDGELTGERAEYWDFKGVYVDYDTQGIVRALRLDTKATDWKIFNGIKSGNPIDKIRENYPADHFTKYPDSENILVVAYDESGNSIGFSKTAKYFVRFSQAEKKAEIIVIQENPAGQQEASKAE